MNRQLLNQGPRWTVPLMICIGLVCLTVATYWNVLHCSFVNYDDEAYVFRDHEILSKSFRLRWYDAWNSFVCGNWHPLTVLSLGVDDMIWGLNPFGYHATNLAFHCVNVLLIFLVLKQLTRSSIPSACVAALFAVHPLHVESVAWVAERKDVLSTFFLLLVIAAYIRYATRPDLVRYGIVFVLMGLGLLAKPMLVTLPILLLLLDFWPLDRIEVGLRSDVNDRFPRQKPVWLIGEKIPLLGLSLVDGLMTILAQGDARDVLSKTGIETRIAHMFYSYFWYLEKTFVPLNLVVFYPHPEQNLSWPSIGSGVATFVLISVLTFWQMKTRPHLAFGWCWFVIALLPVIGLIQVGAQAYADRYTYIPHIGLFVAIVWEVCAWAGKSKWTSVLGGLVLTIGVLSCAVLSHKQISYWTNSETLWTHAVDLFPDNGLAQLGLGNSMVENQKYEEAIPHIARGIELNKYNEPNGYFVWGLCLIELGRPAEAEEKLLEAFRCNPNNEKILAELANLMRRQNRFEEADKYSAKYEQLMASRSQLNPLDYRTEIDLGLRMARQGKPNEAIKHFEKAIQLAPHSAAALNNLANAQLELGQLKPAKENFIKALAVNSELSGAHFNLAAILETEQDREGARHHYAEAYRIDPNDSEARQKMEQLSQP